MKRVEADGERSLFSPGEAPNLHETYGAKFEEVHFYGWKRGLKTGMHYLRTRPAAQAIQFTVDHALVTQVKQQKEKQEQEDQQSTAVASALTPLDEPPSASSEPSTAYLVLPLTPADSLAGLYEAQRRAAEKYPEFAAALLRKKARELEEAKLACSIENKEACVMCSG